MVYLFTKKTVKIILLLIFLSINNFIFCGILGLNNKKNNTTEYKKNTITKQYIAPYVKTPPIIDGLGNDSCWLTIPAIKCKNNTEEPSPPFKIKVCHDSKSIYVLLSFYRVNEQVEHRPWKWNSLQEVYESTNKQMEETVYFICNKDASINFKVADLWVWRAKRNNIAGFADDYLLQKIFLIDNNDNLKYIPDKGDSAWYSKYFAEFAGDTLPRFYQRTPTKSMSDVRTKGRWDSHYWTIEFSRLLYTRNDDDIDLSESSLFFISVGSQPPKDIDKINFIPIFIDKQ